MHVLQIITTWLWTGNNQWVEPTEYNQSIAATRADEGQYNYCYDVQSSNKIPFFQSKIYSISPNLFFRTTLYSPKDESLIVRFALYPERSSIVPYTCKAIFVFALIRENKVEFSIFSVYLNHCTSTGNETA